MKKALEYVGNTTSIPSLLCDVNSIVSQFEISKQTLSLVVKGHVRLYTHTVTQIHTYTQIHTRTLQNLPWSGYGG